MEAYYRALIFENLKVCHPVVDDLSAFEVVEIDVRTNHLRQYTKDT